MDGRAPRLHLQHAWAHAMFCHSWGNSNALGSSSVGTAWSGGGLWNWENEDPGRSMDQHQAWEAGRNASQAGRQCTEHLRDLRDKDDDHSKSEHLRDFLTDLRAESRYDEM